VSPIKDVIVCIKILTKKYSWILRIRSKTYVPDGEYLQPKEELRLGIDEEGPLPTSSRI
jgi:hypothetical protein